MRGTGRRTLARLGGRLVRVLPALCLSFTLGARPAVGAPEAALVYGSWALGVDSVVDGDTLRVPDEPTVRVLAIDCEEVFKKQADRDAAAADFDAYAASKGTEGARPAKYGTPMGETAKTYLRSLMGSVEVVRLERDRVGGRELDVYERRLAHVILVTPGGEVNLAEAMIRKGYSPYFVKYGRSLRFDRPFREAETEAQVHKRGIWGDAGPAHYPDYAQRLEWWRGRADQVDRWRARDEGPERVLLGTVRTEGRLAARVGKHVTVFGVLSRKLETSDQSRTIFLLSDRKQRGFPLVVFDKTVLGALDMSRIESMYVTARGTVSLYRGQPQIVVDRAEQISTD